MEDKLTAEEKSLFDLLSKETNPPEYLEKKIIQELKEKSLIHSEKSFIMTRKASILSIAASILMFICGYLFGNIESSSSTEITSGYILLLHEDERFQPVGTEMEIFTEYASWMGKMMLSGINITGNDLLPESSKTVSLDELIVGGTRDDKISGYFIIDVSDKEEAEKIALSSPHIKFGGTVELIKLSERN